MASSDNKDKSNNFDINTMLTFVKKNARYFVAGVLFLLILLILIKFTGNGKTAGADNGQATASTEVTVEAFEENAHPEVAALIESYYNAYAAGDLGTLATIATPISTNEQGYISLFSQYVESYQNMIYYTKTGLDANSYLVNVYVEVKFAGVDTAAPGLDFFYVRTNEDGNLYIDNLYSQYNLNNNDNALDTSVQNLINEYKNQEDVIALLQDVQQKYETALGTDENLTNMVNVTIPTAISEWVTTMVAQNTEATETVEATETPEEVPAEEPVEETPETTQETVRVTDRVNIRAAADASSDRLGSADAGTTFTRTGTEGDWSIIDYNGTTAYIMSEYLTTDTGAASTGTTTSNGPAEGETITLQNTTNIRSSMSETSDRVGVAYAGERVTVVANYAEGWTRVNWGNETGYVKTDLLQ